MGFCCGPGFAAAAGGDVGEQHGRSNGTDTLGPALEMDRCW